MDVPGLQEGKEYMFRVKAVNDEGESEPLETDHAVLAKDPFCKFLKFLFLVPLSASFFHVIFFTCMYQHVFCSFPLFTCSFTPHCCYLTFLILFHVFTLLFPSALPNLISHLLVCHNSTLICLSSHSYSRQTRNP